MKKSFSKYRAIVKDRKNRENEFRKISLNLLAHHKRWAFDAWHKRTVKMKLCDEVNTVGPITEQVFEANRAIRNLKAFMLGEGYTKDEIHA